MRTQKNLFDKIHSIVQLKPNDENILQKTIFSTENATAAFFVANYINKCFEKRKDIIHQSCLMSTLLIRNDVQN